jgi:hypothetical protein
MFDSGPAIPEHVKLGKAKALETMVLGSTRVFKKAKVRYWVERQGAREDFCVVHHDRVHRLTSYEFKRKFKVIIIAGAVKKAAPAAEPAG